MPRFHLAAPRFGKRFSAGTKFSRGALRVCDSRSATAAGHGRAFTLLVLLVLMATIGAAPAPPLASLSSRAVA